MVFWVRTEAGLMNSSPPSLMRTVRVVVGVKVLVTCCLRSTTLVEAGGNEKSKLSVSGASPETAIMDSKVVITFMIAKAS
jgi:hypothetical protein